MPTYCVFLMPEEIGKTVRLMRQLKKVHLRQEVLNAKEYADLTADIVVAVGHMLHHAIESNDDLILFSLASPVLCACSDKEGEKRHEV